MIADVCIHIYIYIYIHIYTYIHTYSYACIQPTLTPACALHRSLLLRSSEYMRLTDGLSENIAIAVSSTESEMSAIDASPAPEEPLPTPAQLPSESPIEDASAMTRQMPKLPNDTGAGNDNSNSRGRDGQSDDSEADTYVGSDRTEWAS